MYYDRRISPDLLALLAPDGALAWLVPWLRSDAAGIAGAHVQFRRDRSSREGRIQVYVGRTSPLVIRGMGRGRVRLTADPFYVALSPPLFAEAVEVAGLGAFADALREHLERAATNTHRSFLDGEAVAHAGLIRLYGPLAGPDEGFLAVDSEARLGFASQPEQIGFEAALRERVGLPAREDLPRKLDLVGLRQDGAVLLIEVKADATGLARAAWQAAAHVARFRALVDEQPAWGSEVLAAFAEQKRAARLLGATVIPHVRDPAVLVPVIAAPDSRPEWRSAWAREIEPVLRVAGPLLDGLRLWRLDQTGALLDDEAV